MEASNSQTLLRAFNSTPPLPLGFDKEKQAFINLDLTQKYPKQIETSLIEVAKRISTFMLTHVVDFDQYDFSTIKKGFIEMANKSGNARVFAQDRLQLMKVEADVKILDEAKRVFLTKVVLDYIPTVRNFNLDDKKAVFVSYCALNSQERNVCLSFKNVNDTICTVNSGNIFDGWNFVDTVNSYVKQLTILKEYQLLKFPIKIRILPLDKTQKLDNFDGISIRIHSNGFSLVSKNEESEIFPINKFREQLAITALQLLFTKFRFIPDDGTTNYKEIKTFTLCCVYNNEIIFSYRSLQNDQRNSKAYLLQPDKIGENFIALLEKRRTEFFARLRTNHPKFCIKQHDKKYEPPFYKKYELENLPYKCLISYADDDLDLEGSFYFFKLNENRVERTLEHSENLYGNIERFLNEIGINETLLQFNKSFPQFIYSPWKGKKNGIGSIYIDFNERKDGVIVRAIDENEVLKEHSHSNAEFTEVILFKYYLFQKTVSIISYINKAIGKCIFARNNGSDNRYWITGMGSVLQPHTPIHFNLKYWDRINNKMIEFDLKETFEKNIEKALSIYRREKDLYFQKLQAIFGKHKVMTEKPDYIPDDAIVILVGDFLDCIWMKDFFGKEISCLNSSNTIEKARFYEECVKGLKILKECIKANPHQKITFGDSKEEKSAICVDFDENKRVYGISYFNQNKECWITARAQLANLQITLSSVIEAFIKIKEEVEINERYLTSFKARSSVGCGTEIPPYLKEGKLELLAEFLGKINFTDKTKPDYYDPKDVLEEKEVILLPTLISNLDHFIKTVNEGKAGYYGVPKNEIEREAYYTMIRAYMSQIIVKLSDHEITPLLRNETVLAFAKAGTRCGGRWAGEVIEQYNSLFLRGKKTLADLVILFLDEFKIGLIKQMVNEGTKSAHEYLAICKILTQYGIGIPAGAHSDFNDPYRNDALLGNYKDDEKVRKGFMKLFQASEIINTMGSRFNEEIKASKGKFIVQFLEPFRELSLKLIETEVKWKKQQDAISKIEADYQVKKAVAEKNQELIDVASQERVNAKNQVVDKMVLAQKYFLLDEFDVPFAIKRRGVIALLTHYGLLERNKTPF